MKQINTETILCWLIDYGILHETKQVYFAEDKIYSCHTFVKQACLNSIVPSMEVSCICQILALD